MSAVTPRKLRILMVCLGNICRSPTAHGVLQKYIADRGLEALIEVDSAGTGDWHIGENPDSRAVAAARQRGYDISHLLARQVAVQDYDGFDYILAMDRNNLAQLRAGCPSAHRRKLQLLLAYGSLSHDTVPDPYYSGDQGFELVLDLLEDACESFLAQLCSEHFPEHADTAP